MCDRLLKESDVMRAVSLSCGPCLARNTDDCEKCSVPKLRELINAIPSADRSQGEWIEAQIRHYVGYRCSLCHYGVQPWNNTNYCPNCGARMKGADNEQQN